MTTEETSNTATETNDVLLREVDAAAFLGWAVKTLQNKRVTGNGPRFIKLGTSPRAAVRYRMSSLIRFRDQFEVGSTAEHAIRAAQASA